MRGFEAANDADARQGNANAPLQSYIDRADLEGWFLDEPAASVATLERGLSAHPPDSIPLVERPYDQLARAFARAGRPDRARAYLEAFDRRRAEVRSDTDELIRHQLVGHIAIAERRWEEAVRAYRAADQGRCPTCALPDLARAYDLAGNADSAIAVYARYVGGPTSPERLFVDGSHLAGAHRRLGELYESRGDARRAAAHYAEFIELWKDADAELQPLVRTARERLAALQRAERS